MTDNIADKDAEIANLRRQIVIATLKQNPDIAPNSHGDLYGQLFATSSPIIRKDGSIAMEWGESLDDAVEAMRVTKPHYFPNTPNTARLSKTGHSLDDLKKIADPKRLLEIANRRAVGGAK